MTARYVIDLGALAANYRKLSGAHELAAVVKADAYGFGAPAVVKKLRSEGCSTFFVATFGEAVALRSSAPDITIYVLNGVLPTDHAEAQAKALRPVLNSVGEALAWRSSGAGSCAVHIDTGMQRLGIEPEALSELHIDKLGCELVMTHFARADEPDHPFNLTQLERFDACLAVVRQTLPEVQSSYGNSGALLAGRVGDIGRAGIALYGGNPFSDRANPMDVVLRFEAPVLQTRRVPKCTPVGYGGAAVTRRDSVIATVGCGYADGVPRAVSEAGGVYAGAKRLPFLGRISMDLLQIDATDAPAIQAGDWVEVFGAHISVDEVADWADTIAYEIFTGLGSRAERIYLDS